ncbi:hypothetical protein L5515_017797 [Caenorhabditis briggsae]|uniref:Uncharacterized protein n=2 Tax=Caenorhabditis briggsae TaxID=6238 RepID=A0AAE9JRE5_CAEBR|nr:hypothetical protein L5515_017797 [Caenorhabditis briggsae]
MNHSCEQHGEPLKYDWCWMKKNSSFIYKVRRELELMSNESTPFSTVAVAQKSRTWTSPLMGDAARARIAAREALLESRIEKSKTQRLTARRFDTNRGTARLFLEARDVENSQGKMEVKITINMKQLEKHHREIDSYISSFNPHPESRFLRIPPMPIDYARVELVRDILDNLCRNLQRMSVSQISDDDLRMWLERLRKLDVRLTALYPRTPAPGDPNKKSFRMCPCFEPEMNDIEKLICEYAMDSGATAFYLKRNPPRFPGTPSTSGNLYMKYRNSRFLRRQPP